MLLVVVAMCLVTEIKVRLRTLIFILNFVFYGSSAFYFST